MKSRCYMMKPILLVSLAVAVMSAWVTAAVCQEAATGRRGMVASVDEYASRAGVEVLERGGNSVDAAVAVHMVLAVTHPQAGNLGGGGFMIIHMEAGGKTGAESAGEASREAKVEEHDVNTAIDFREKAPLRATRDMYLDEAGEVIADASTLGYLACGVPGSAAGMWAIHQKYGTLPWEDLLEPAYRLAKDGFRIGPLLARDLKDAHEHLTRFPATAAIFTKDGAAFEEGDMLIQEDLAWTIRQIMDRGMDGFYKGEVAARIAADMKANGGLITQEDLEKYRPHAREPIVCDFAGHTVVSMPPPSSGGLLLCQMLAMLSDYDLKALGHNSAGYIHLLTEVEKLAYADRAAYLGDADYYPVPVDHLLSSDYIALRVGGIDLEHATPSRSVTAGPGPPTRTETRIQDIRGSPPVGDSQESPETTHFSIVDRDGNAVSCTTTLNGRFGSCVVAAGTGVLLNNEMDDFSMKPGVPNIYGLVGGEANAIEPEKRMLSSMTPTIVLGHGDAGGRSMGTEERARDEAPYEHRDDEQRDHDNRNADSRHADDHDADSGAERESYVELVLGSPGGSTIITTVLQVILNVLVHDLSLEEAVAVPRFHHQWLPDETRVESGGIPEGVLEDLEKMGHVIIEVEALGDIHAVMVLGLAQAARVEGAPGTSWEPAEDYTGDAHDQEAPLLIGVSDPRRGGTAIGY